MKKEIDFYAFVSLSFGDALSPSTQSILHLSDYCVLPIYLGE